MRVVFLVSALAIALAACGGHPSAVAPKEAQDGPAAGKPQSGALDRADRADPRDAPIPQIDGKPMWAPNRQHTAEENAKYQFDKNGADFGAKSEDDYVAKAHAFVAHPPADSRTLERANGDRLIYDPRSNSFAVASKDGAPRTFFKPKNGPAYWVQQKDREEKRAAADAG